MPVQAQSLCYNHLKAKAATQSQQSFPVSWLRQPLKPTGEGQNQQLLTGLFYSLWYLPLKYCITFFDLTLCNREFIWLYRVFGWKWTAWQWRREKFVLFWILLCFFFLQLLFIPKGALELTRTGIQLWSTLPWKQCQNSHSRLCCLAHRAASCTHTKEGSLPEPLWILVTESRWVRLREENYALVTTAVNCTLAPPSCCHCRCF